MDKKIKREYRYFLKDSIRKTVDFSQTDQSKGLKPPPLEKPYSKGAAKIELPKPENWNSIGEVDLSSAIGNRKSRRQYRKEALTLDELSYLLWATQGIRGKPYGGNAFRTVPSAGCRHAFETYLAIFQVEGLKQGVYRYLPLTHELLWESSPPQLSEEVSRATFGQAFTGRGAATFIWTAIPYRMEWRYGPAAYKVIALDAGHVCQNLYLACEAIGAGTCAIAAYNQDVVDALLGVDGEDEFVIYLAPVGKVTETY